MSETLNATILAGLDKTYPERQWIVLPAAYQEESGPCGLYRTAADAAAALRFWGFALTAEYIHPPALDAIDPQTLLRFSNGKEGRFLAALRKS